MAFVERVVAVATYVAKGKIGTGETSFFAFFHRPAGAWERNGVGRSRGKRWFRTDGQRPRSGQAEIGED